MCDSCGPSDKTDPQGSTSENRTKGVQCCVNNSVSKVFGASVAVQSCHFLCVHVRGTNQRFQRRVLVFSQLVREKLPRL